METGPSNTRRYVDPKRHFSTWWPQMKNWVVLPFCILLAACASAPPAPRADNLFSDQLFAPASERISVDDVFALSPAMQQYLSSGEISYQLHAKGVQQGLFDALYNKTLLKLDYNAEHT